MKRNNPGSQQLGTSGSSGKKNARGQARQGTNAVLSTKDAARICKVALSTIVYWFDKGLIKGYRTPGGHRRIFMSDLEEFMKDHEIPLGGRMPDEKFKVLVVDDEAVVVDFLVKTMRAINPEIEVASARNGFQAGRLLSTFRPNLVFLDLVMPNLDGFEVCKLIKDDPETAEIEVIAITGHDSPENVDRITKAGAAKVLVKPIRVDDVESIIRTRVAGNFRAGALRVADRP